MGGSITSTTEASLATEETAAMATESVTTEQKAATESNTEAAKAESTASVTAIQKKTAVKSVKQGSIAALNQTIEYFSKLKPYELINCYPLTILVLSYIFTSLNRILNRPQKLLSCPSLISPSLYHLQNNTYRHPSPRLPHWMTYIRKG